MVRVSDENRQRKYTKRRSKLQMIHAVQEADRLMATGLAEHTARHAVKLSKTSYDMHKEVVDNLQVGSIAFEQPTPPPQPKREPWICPRCDRVNAPFMPWCDCGKKG